MEQNLEELEFVGGKWSFTEENYSLPHIFLVEKDSFYSEKIYHGNRLIALFSCLFLPAEPQGYHSEDQNIFVG